LDDKLIDNKFQDWLINDCKYKLNVNNIFDGNLYSDRIVLYLQTYLYVRFMSNTPFLINPMYDYRGRLYYMSVLSPTFNRPVRNYINIIRHDEVIDFTREIDINSSMITLMLSLTNDTSGHCSEIVKEIINGNFDAHSYTLFKTLQKLKEINIDNTFHNMKRKHWKSLTSPVMYGSAILGNNGIYPRIQELIKTYNSLFGNAKVKDIRELQKAMLFGVYSSFIDIPAMRKQAYSLLKDDDYVANTFKYKISKLENVSKMIKIQIEGDNNSKKTLETFRYN